MAPGFSIVGCGKVGITLARHLAQAGYIPKGFTSRTPASAQTAMETAGAGICTTDRAAVTEGADLVFITTPDGLIGQVCAEMADQGAFGPSHTVLHCSGSLPSTVLEPARKAGAHIGSVHPLQSFAADFGDHNPFAGIVMAVEGDEAAVEAGLDLAARLGSRGFCIQTEAKTLYHASAVVASNCLVTLVDFAYQLLAASGIGHKDAYTVLGPLIEGTLSNIKRVGPVKALTGPVVRGDAETVSAHLGAIAESLPHLSELYTILGRHTVDIARRRGTLTDEAEAALRRLLG
ncbi:Rossmann-like and DUF2520 domain-containing protein [Desulfatiferula olefinivorans]